MEEILPGIHHWTSMHEKIGAPVHSYFLVDAEGGVLIDPRVPDEGLGWFERHGEPHDVLLTNRHHYRQSDRFAEAFRATIHCHRAGLHEFTAGQAVEPFEHGNALPNGYLAIEVGILCPEETAFHTVRENGILCLGDCVIRMNGELGFVPDKYIGADPERVKRGIKERLAAILADQRFDHVLLAHGAPIVGGADEALRAFAGS